MRQKHRRLTYRGRMVRNLILALLLLYAVWAAAGYPLFSHRLELRRAERSYHLEPGEILTSVSTQANGPDFLIVRGEQACEVFRVPSGGLTGYEAELFLYEQAGEFTLVPLPSTIYGTSTGYYKGCMLVFGQLLPGAARAELIFCVEGETYTAEAQGETDGVLVFFFQGNHRHGASAEEDDSLAEYNTLKTIQGNPLLASGTLRLYDGQDGLLGEYEVPPGALLAGDAW
ncbi:MAG: hypothetical protein ACI3VB_07680 [Oscillospiraceae bacterium]